MGASLNYSGVGIVGRRRWRPTDSGIFCEVAKSICTNGYTSFFPSNGKRGQSTSKTSIVCIQAGKLQKTPELFGNYRGNIAIPFIGTNGCFCWLI
jgi:hypothetical protein